jgi:hypothetical protein
VLLATVGVAHSLTVDPAMFAENTTRLLETCLRVAYSVVYPVEPSCIRRSSVIWYTEFVLSFTEITYLPPRKVVPLKESTTFAVVDETVTELDPRELSLKLTTLETLSAPVTVTELEKVVEFAIVVLPWTYRVLAKILVFVPAAFEEIVTAFPPPRPVMAKVLEFIVTLEELKYTLETNVELAAVMVTLDTMARFAAVSTVPPLIW